MSLEKKQYLNRKIVLKIFRFQKNHLMKLITKSHDKVANITPLSPMYKASAETWPSSKRKMYAECYILM